MPAASSWKPTNGIKYHRLCLGLTQTEVAARLDVPPKHVCAWERWHQAPNDEQQLRLAEVLKCKVEQLLEVASIDIENEVRKMEEGKVRRGPKLKWRKAGG